jgi:ABC-2 type transport system permease protein
MTVERVVSESVTTGPGSVDESTARSAVALDLTPAPGGAPAWRCVLAHAAIQTRVQLRNPEQLLVAIVIPLLALVVLSRTALVSGSGPRIDLAVPGVLALAVLSTAFASLSITTGFERSHGVLRRLGATPLSRGGLLGGKALSVLGVVAAQTVVIVAVGLLLGWHPRVGHPVGAAAATLGLLVLGIAALAPLALLIAGTLAAETTLGVANLCYVLLLGVSAVLVPVSHYPHAVRPLAEGLPSGALADSLRGLWSSGGVHPAPLLIMATWAVVGSLLAVRYFRWD